MSLIYLLLLFVQPPTDDDLAAARARAAAAYEASQQEKELDSLFTDEDKVVPEVKPPVESVSVEWQSVPVSAPQQVTTTQQVNYIVTQDNCPPCDTMKADYTRRGIPFTEISVETARAMGYRITGTPTPITRQEQVVTSVQSSEQVAVAVVDGHLDRMVLQVLSDHLTRQAPEPPPVKGLFDVDLDAPPFLPGLLNDLLIKQKYTNTEQGITAEWPGKTSISVSAGTFSISPPIKVTKLVGIFSVKCSLDSVRVSEGGHRVDLSLSGSPDVTILLKGTPYKLVSDQPQASVVVKKVRSVSDQPQNYTEQERQKDINHLLTAPAHKGKFTRDYLETLSGYELIDLHNTDHGVPTLRGIRVSR